MPDAAGATDYRANPIVADFLARAFAVPPIRYEVWDGRTRLTSVLASSASAAVEWAENSFPGAKVRVKRDRGDPSRNVRAIIHELPYEPNSGEDGEATADE